MKIEIGRYEIEVIAKTSISVKNTQSNMPALTFKIGDQAEYDSYNLSYYGPILAITEKTITIQELYSTKTRRLKLENFAMRNWNFQLANAQAENEQISHYI